MIKIELEWFDANEVKPPRGKLVLAAIEEHPHTVIKTIWSPDASNYFGEWDTPFLVRAWAYFPRSDEVIAAMNGVKYQVLDNGRKADCFHHNVHQRWNKSLFDSFEEAEKYALEWLGDYAPKKGVIKTNEPYDYSGFGDNLEIMVVND